MTSSYAEQTTPTSASLPTCPPAHAHPALTAALDRARRRILAGEGCAATSELVDLLDRIFTDAPEDTQAALVAACRSHALHDLLLQDPYTARAFRKPRGYAGDAVMMDYVYSGAPPQGTTPAGRDVFLATTGCSTAKSVVARRDLLAQRVDAAAGGPHKPNILAVASGHLREAAPSTALAAGAIGSYVALDQDPDSLAVVDRDYEWLGVRTIRESVGGLLKGRTTFVDLDLVYAAGLFDYLDDRSARALVERLFAMLRPGGRLLVANFTPTHQARGYMACFMDWQLVLRDERALASLVESIAPEQKAELHTHTDAFGNVAYVEVVRG